MREVVSHAPQSSHNDTFHPKQQPNISRNVEWRPAPLLTVLRVGEKSHWCSAVNGQCAYPAEREKILKHTSIVLTRTDVSLPITVSFCARQQIFKFHVFRIKRSTTDIKAHNRKQVLDRSE